MTEAEKQQRRIALAVSGGRCEVCGEPLGTNGQGAHRIANTDANRRKWGNWIIDHPFNIKMVCSLKCNDACNIGNNLGECLDLVEAIVAYTQKRFKK